MERTVAIPTGPVLADSRESVAHARSQVTPITGFYGMNVPYPGFSDKTGFLVSVVIMVGAGTLLYWVFRRRDWL